MTKKVDGAQKSYILAAYYIPDERGETKTLKAIADELSYTHWWIRHLHLDALKDFEGIYAKQESTLFRESEGENTP